MDLALSDHPAEYPQDLHADALSALIEQTAAQAADDPDHWRTNAQQAREAGRLADARGLLEAAVQRFPDAPWLWHDLVRLAEARGDWADAERCARTLVDLIPRLWWSATLHAHAVRRQGRIDEAEALLKSAKHRCPNDPEIFTEHALLAELRRDWPQARARWNTVSERFPQNWRGLGGQARLLREQGQTDQARALLIRAMETFPRETGPIHDLARLAEMLRDWTATERWWRVWLVFEPKYWWGYTGLATALREQGRLSEADAVLLPQFERFQQEPAIFVEYARNSERSADAPEALRRWQAVQARFPNLWEGYDASARLLREQGDTAAATHVLTEAITRFPTMARPLHELAQLAEATQDWTAAVKYWHASMALEPDISWVHSALATALREQGEPALAAQVLADAIKRFPGEAALAVASARLAEASDDWEAAVRRWDYVCQAFPHLPSGPVGLAQALRRIGELDKAANILKAAASRLPGDLEIILQIAWLAEMRGQADEAAYYFRQAISLQPENPRPYLFLTRIYLATSDTVQAEKVLADGLNAAGEKIEFLLELARLSARKGDWPEASRRFRLAYAKFPAESASVAGLADSLCRQGLQPEAEAALHEAIGRFPENVELAVAFARLPSVGGARQFPEYLQRARQLVTKFPANLEVFYVLIDALLLSNLPNETETFIVQGLKRFPNAKLLSRRLATAYVRQQKWDNAFNVYTDLIARHGPDPDVLNDYVKDLIAAKRWDDANTLLRQAMTWFPANPVFSVAKLDVLIALNELTEATQLWTTLNAKADRDPSLRKDLFERRGLLLGLGIDPATAAPMVAKATGYSTDDEIPTAEIVSNFESMGGAGLGCEFGLFQRFFGAEPLGLLRWTEMEPEQLLAALEMAFDGVGNPDQTIMRVPEHGNHLEYGASDRRFGMRMHTFVRADQIPADKMFVQLCRRLTYLRSKFLADLREGDKIFVYKNAYRNLSDDEIARLHDAVRRYGKVTWLYVRRQTENNRFPNVEALEPGLLIGNIDQFAVGLDGKESSLPASSWAAVARNAYCLWRNI